MLMFMIFVISVFTFVLVNCLISRVDTLAKKLKGLKSQVDKFLQPEIRFFIRDVLKRRIVMKDSEKQVAAMAVTDAKGFPVDQPIFDAPPAWAIDDPAVASLAPSADGLSCDVVAIKPGATKLNASAAAAGVNFAGSVDVLVTAGDAAQISISLGAAVPQ